MRLIDMTGQQHGRLTVLCRAENLEGKTRWRCRCACGSQVDVDAYALRSGHSKSCGCLSADTARANHTTHGRRHEQEYQCWRNMLRRCYLPSSPSYKNYGARGITVCEEWRESFDAFKRDMGPRPSAKHSLDRLDNNLGYAPGNVKWALPAEQALNKRTTLLIEHDGVVAPLVVWSRKLGLPASTIKGRYMAGRPINEPAVRRQA